jgi:hypothetical protein
MEREVANVRKFDHASSVARGADPRIAAAKGRVTMDESQLDAMISVVPPVTSLTNGAYNVPGSTFNLVFQIDLSADAQLLLDAQATAVCFDVEIGRVVTASVGDVTQTIPLTATESYPWFLPVFLDNVTMNTGDSNNPLVNYAGQNLLANFETRMYMGYSRESLAREQFILCNRDGRFLEETFDTAEQFSDVTTQRTAEHFLTSFTPVVDGAGVPDAASILAGHKFVLRRRVRIPLSFLVGAMDRPYWLSSTRQLWLTFTFKPNDDILWRHFALNSRSIVARQSSCRPGGPLRIVCNVVRAEMQVVQIRLNPKAEIANVYSQRANMPENLLWLEQFSLKTLFSNTGQVQINQVSNLQSVLFGWKAFDVSSPAVTQIARYYGDEANADANTAGGNLFVNPMQWLTLSRLVPLNSRIDDVASIGYGNFGSGVRVLSLLIGNQSYPLRPMRFSWVAVPKHWNQAANAGTDAVSAARASSLLGDMNQAHAHYMIASGWVARKLGTPVISLADAEGPYGFFLISMRDSLLLAEADLNARCAIQITCEPTQPGPGIDVPYVQGKNMTVVLNTTSAAALYADGSAVLLKSTF